MTPNIQKYDNKMKKERKKIFMVLINFQIIIKIKRRQIKDKYCSDFKYIVTKYTGWNINKTQIDERQRGVI